MAINIALNTSLQESIHRGEFFSLHDADALYLIRDAFLPELERLKNAPPAAEPGATAISDSDNSHGKRPSPSRLLFGSDYDEVNRTLVSMLALKWVIADDYNAFTCCQSSFDKLRPGSFTRLRDLFSEGLKTPADVFTVLVATIINDLGKDPSLAEDVAKITGRSLHGFNHDMVVYEAAEVNLVPCIRLLDISQRKKVMLGLELGSTLNIGQLIQAENVPGSLAGLLIMKGHEDAFDLKFMQQLLDIAGAAGHVEAWCAKQMIEPVFQAFIATRGVLADIITHRSSLRTGYDKILLDRGLMLQEKGFRHLSVQVPQERALLRLLTMGRTADKVQAEWFADVFYSLPGPIRQKLVEGLNVDGYDDGKAILPYYMPAIFSAGIKNTIGATASTKNLALASLMRFLARVLEGTKPSPGLQGVVIERSVIFAKDVVRSEAFRADPSVLDELQIPIDG